MHTTNKLWVIPNFLKVRQTAPAPSQGDYYIFFDDGEVIVRVGFNPTLTITSPSSKNM
jgi:hypothetical protein